MFGDYKSDSYFHFSSFVVQDIFVVVFLLPISYKYKRPNKKVQNKRLYLMQV